MINFQYSRATDVADAIFLLAAHPGAKLIAGGTNLIDLMKMGVEAPDALVDINRLPLAQVEELPGNNGIRIGALVRNYMQPRFRCVPREHADRVQQR